MRRPLTHLWTGTRWCLSCLGSFLLWSVWLILAGLLAVQCYIATHHELEIPGFLLRSLEERLAASGVRATFGRTSFDPTGRVLIENARLSLPAFDEPIVAARVVYVRLDPWALAVGQFEPAELRVSGASLAVAAMLSPSGRSDEILRDLDITLRPHEKQIELAQLTGRIAGVSLVAHGAVHLPPRERRKSESLPVADFLARNYAALARQLVVASRELAALDRPAVQLRLEPSDTRVAIAHLSLFAEGVTLSAPQPLSITGLHAATQFPLFGDAAVPAQLSLTADAVALPYGADARHVRTLVRGSLSPGRLQFVPADLDLMIGSVAAAGFNARDLTIHLKPGPLPRLTADLSATLVEAPMAVLAQVDLDAQTAVLRFDGALSTHLLTPLSELIHVNIRRFFDYEAIDRIVGEARLGPGWKFEHAAARVDLRRINAYRIIMEEGRATFTTDGRTFYAPEAYARIGDNYAIGSFEQDFTTRDYRFLLDGQLRPIALSPWFQDWWPNFFKQLDFTAALPDASVEVSGRWGEGRRSKIFVFADVAKPVIRGAALDRVRTRLFIRPGFYDGPEAFATHPTGTAAGAFTYLTEPGSGDWKTLNLDLATTLDPSVAIKMLGALGESIFSPFKWAAPPVLKLSGHIDGIAAPKGPRTVLHLEAQPKGEFRFQDFPLDDVSFTADIDDNLIDLPRLSAKFAEGALSGKARVFGEGKDRRVNFDFALKDASLGRAVAALQDYTARRNNVPPSPPNKFMQERASVRMDLSAAAEGRYDDMYTYQGKGEATLKGAGLGEIQLLGLLSDLFTFTALRFNSAHSTFKIDGAKLTFPDLVLRGANSAIDAHGDFALDRRTLDFKAKLFPFQASNNPLKSLLGTVLSPLSNFFEVNLNGTLDHPDWSFVVGPTSFLRSLTGSDPTKPNVPASPVITPSPLAPTAVTPSPLAPSGTLAPKPPTETPAATPKP